MNNYLEEMKKVDLIKSLKAKILRFFSVMEALGQPNTARNNIVHFA
jgi:hypothetical protein